MSPAPRRAPAVALLALALTAGAAHAWPSLSGGGEGLLDVRSAPVGGPGALGIQIGSWSYQHSAGSVPGDRQDRFVSDGGLHVTYGIGGWGEAYLRGNLAFFAIDTFKPISNRDAQVGLKVSSPRRYGPVIPGIVLDLNLPVGNRTRGFSTDALDPGLTALFTVPLPESNTFSAANLHFNLGYRAHGDDRGRTYEGWPLYYLEPVYPEGENDRLDLRAAVEVVSSETTLFGELLLDQLLHEDIAFSESPMFVSLGFRRGISDHFSLLGATKIALSSDDPGTTRFRDVEDLFPDWQFGLALAWSRGGSGADADEDGVPDLLDQCPHQREDLDGWMDEDGCPDADNDGDGVKDEFDGDPDRPEDYDGYLDTDGIPDPDNDGDGIPDTEDECPLGPEDLDGVADEDGCPETDADGDGIPDEGDSCPEEAETLNGIEDDDGCPEDDTNVRTSRPLTRIRWEGDAVQPERGGFVELGELVSQLQADPTIRLEIRVRTLTADADDAAFELGVQRAEFLKAYVVASGGDVERIRAIGEAGPDPRTGYTGSRPNEGRARVTWVKSPETESPEESNAPDDAGAGEAP